jgi:hypothetical protein
MPSQTPFLKADSARIDASQCKIFFEKFLAQQTITDKVTAPRAVLRLRGNLAGQVFRIRGRSDDSVKIFPYTLSKFPFDTVKSHPSYAKETLTSCLAPRLGSGSRRIAIRTRSGQPCNWPRRSRPANACRSRNGPPNFQDRLGYFPEQRRAEFLLCSHTPRPRGARRRVRAAIHNPQNATIKEPSSVYGFEYST